MFKVVPDQLRISEGWVRCGQCGEIFNASQNLVAGEPPSERPPAAPTPVPVPMPPPPAPAPEPALAPGQPPEPPGVGAATVERQAFEQKVWDLEPAPEDLLPGPPAPDTSAQTVAVHASDTKVPAPPTYVPMEPVWAEEPHAPDTRGITADALSQADAPTTSAEPAPVTNAHAGSRFTDDDTGLPAFKRARAEGKCLDAKAYALLRHCTPIHAVSALVAIRRLFDEECELLMQLRELQIKDKTLVFNF